ncbi:glycosyltransferase family 4 protein [Aeromonas veronii]
MRVIYDGVIELLQSGGGCTVYFKELINNSCVNSFAGAIEYYCYVNQESSFSNEFKKNIMITDVSNDIRIAERWRDVDISLSLKEYNIFHSTHYRLPLQKQNTKIVTTVHDFTYEIFRKGPARWMHSWQKFRAIKNSDLVICVSQNTAGDLMRFCPIDRDKIRVVYNGVSESYYPINGVDKSNSVVFVGARGWYKNFALAVRTLQYFPYLNLSIVGGGPLTPEEAALLEEYIPGRYEWLGRVSDSGLNELYNKAYCLFYPSSYEGFGIPVAEAMRSGCPVVAVNTSSIPEVAGDAALLVKEATVDAFKAAFTQLESESIRKKLIIDGLLQAEKFSWKKCYQDTLRVYHELME